MHKMFFYEINKMKISRIVIHKLQNSINLDLDSIQGALLPTEIH